MRFLKLLILGAFLMWHVAWQFIPQWCYSVTETMFTNISITVMYKNPVSGVSSYISWINCKKNY